MTGVDKPDAQISQSREIIWNSPVCHCENPEGAWQSDFGGRDCFASLAMTIFIYGSGQMSDKEDYHFQ
jgi:hypothetical protein